MLLLPTPWLQPCYILCASWMKVHFTTKFYTFQGRKLTKKENFRASEVYHRLTHCLLRLVCLNLQKMYRQPKVVNNDRLSNIFGAKQFSRVTGDLKRACEEL